MTADDLIVFQKVGRAAFVNPCTSLNLLFNQSYYATPLLHAPVLALSKFSLLLLLHRIFVTRRFRITVYVLQAIVVIYFLGTFFTWAFICFPISDMWDPAQQTVCDRDTIVNIATPIPWVATDFAILIAPIPVIKNLQLPKKKRIGLYAMFLFGGAYVSRLLTLHSTPGYQLLTRKHPQYLPGKPHSLRNGLLPVRRRNL